MSIVIREKNILIAMLLLVGFLFVTIIPVSANDNKEALSQKQVIFSKESINDEKVLYERAKKGETDLNFDQSFIKNLSFDKKLIEEFDINTYVTTEKVKEVQEVQQNGNISKEESYIATIFTDLSLKSSGSSYVEQPKIDDQTRSVTCTLRVYFSYRTDMSGSATYFSAKLDRLQSKWTIHDSQMSIRNGYIRETGHGQKVISFNPLTFGAFVKIFGDAPAEYTLIANPSSGVNYTYYPTWNDWLYVYPPETHVGGKTDITIIRNSTGTSWNLSHQIKVNYIYFPI